MPIDFSLENQFDVIVVGGSYAGLSAALQLVRARRRVLVIDSGKRRNRFAETSHGFLGQDGRVPADIASDAKAQLLAYPGANWLDGLAVGVAQLETMNTAQKPEITFSVEMQTGEVVHARRLVLATGVVDEMPEVVGIAERWGKSVFHCPYCHGYELGNGLIGVLATGPMAFHHAMMLPDWGKVTLFTNGNFIPDENQRAAMMARNVEIESVPVLQIQGVADVWLGDGRVKAMAGLFVMCAIRPASPLAGLLGCALESSPLGSFIQTNASKETSVTNVFACGDMARMGGSVALAVGDGAMAGIGAHQSMIFR